MLVGCAHDAEVAPRAPVVVSLEPYVGKLRQAQPTAPPGTHFLFDSGGGLTLLSPAVAASLHCTPYTRLSALRMHGDRFDVTPAVP